MNREQINVENEIENEKSELLMAEFVRNRDKATIRLKFDSDKNGNLVASHNGIVYRISDFQSETKAGEVWECLIGNADSDGCQVVMPIAKINEKQSVLEEKKHTVTVSENKDAKKLLRENAVMIKKLKKSEEEIINLKKQVSELKGIKKDLQQYREKYDEKSKLYESLAEQLNILKKRFEELKKQNNSFQKKDYGKIESELKFSDHLVISA